MIMNMLIINSEMVSPILIITVKCVRIILSPTEMTLSVQISSTAHINHRKSSFRSY